MRIIDKQHDFYDYLQDPTDRIVFDRRGSFLLTKEMFCEGMKCQRYYSDSKYRFVLLQCGVAYWLFLITITEKDLGNRINNYNIELLKNWKNYDGANELIKLSVVSINKHMWSYWLYDMDVEKVRIHVNDLMDAVNQGNYRLEYNLGCHTKVTDYKGISKEEIQSMPILKACGIADLVDPVSIFCALEEHFSMKKTASETTEAKGATDEDKAIMHGFDAKKSFRKMERGN